MDVEGTVVADFKVLQRYFTNEIEEAYSISQNRRSDDSPKFWTGGI